MLKKLIIEFIKDTIRKNTTPFMRNKIKRIFRKGEMSETEMVYKLLKDKNGIMVDVGAHYGSSLEDFAKNGWQVYAFEPDENNRKHLLHICQNYPKVIVDDRAVSNETKTGLAFFSSKVSSGISGLSSFHPTHERTGTVNSITLRDFCIEKNIKHIDFLKIDTEGYDLFVLQGHPWEYILPDVIVCEFEDNKTIPIGYNFHDMAEFLKKYGYFLLISEWYPILEYGETHNWCRFAKYPCKLLSKNAWGNIIAVKCESKFIELINLSEKFSKNFN